MEEVIFFKEFNVVKILERGAFIVWKQISIGTEVFVELEEPENKIILVKIKVENKEDVTKEIKVALGELPEKESEIIRNFLKQKWQSVFKAHICKMDKEALYDQRISIAVYITKSSESK